jgi:three-Cys-motif partner protein
VTDPNLGREQTQAKHFILRRYLQALAFKVLSFQDITYVDGFSGPWQTTTENFSDSSFMIAISVLLDPQKQYSQRTGIRRTIRCFFSENNPQAFAQLQTAVAQYHRPANKFEVKTYCGNFEDSVDEIQGYIGSSFPLIFIDPTGWTGYAFNKIRPLFLRPKCEVLINFMYAFVNRFVHSDDENIITSLEPILGGPGWRDRLDPMLDRGAATEKLFRETLRSAGNFDFVVSTKIDKATTDRPHFYIAYGTKSIEGLKAFRDAEYAARRDHERNRANAKEKRREDRTNTTDMFSGYQATVQEATIDEIVEGQMALASTELLAILSRMGELTFRTVLAQLLEPYILRETNVKDICVKLAKSGKVENTWGTGNRKPRDEHLIRLSAIV